MGRRRVLGALAALLGVWSAQSTAETGSRVLDLEHPQLSQRIDNTDSATFEFVRITVAGVTNPKRVGLLFVVAFIPDGGTGVQLGGFSLFPPDNPGAFIVSTRHLIHSAGVVVVTMHTATPVESGTSLLVTMGAIRLAHSRN